MSYIRVPYHGPPITGAQDQDNFVRDLITLPVGADPVAPITGAAHSRPLSQSLAGQPPVLTLDEIKLHCRIEPDQTAEDSLLAGLEMAARLHTQNVLRRTFDNTCGENVKQAMLLLIGHWYRQRESVSPLTLTEAPQAYMALLWPERDLSDAFGALPPAARNDADHT